MSVRLVVAVLGVLSIPEAIAYHVAGAFSCAWLLSIVLLVGIWRRAR